MRKLLAVLLTLTLVFSASTGFAEAITLNVLNWGNAEEESSAGTSRCARC